MSTTTAYFLLGWAGAMTLALLLLSSTRGPAPPAPVVLETRADPASGSSLAFFIIAGALILFFVWLLNS